MSNRVIPSGSINPNATIAPGVVVIESLTPGAVAGIPTNLVGAVGTATWGPVNAPVSVSTPADYANLFGDVMPAKYDMGTFINAAYLQGTVGSYVCVRVTDGTDTASAANLVDVQTPGIAGVVLTALYTGKTGDSLQATVNIGNVANSYTITIGRPGYVAETFSNIDATGGPTVFWGKVVAAINEGQSGVRGPSKLATATLATGIGQVTVTNPGSGFSSAPAISFTGGGTGAAATAVIGFPIQSVAVSTPGSYATLPTLTTIGAGAGAILAPTMQAVSGTIVAVGSGYAPSDTITLAGGTFGAAALLSVTSTQLASVAANAAGAGYKSLDSITLGGGTATTQAVLKVTSTKLVSTVLNAIGSSYAIGDTIHLAGGTFGTAAILTVATVNGGGGILTFTISTPGSYTVEPSSFTQGSTSGSGTGATFQSATFGVNTFSIASPGTYTANSATFTQAATSGSGTGATFQTALYAIRTVTVNTPGSYTALPGSPVSQSASSGSGTGATFTMFWGLLSVAVSTPGNGYTPATIFSVTGGGGSGATGTLTLASTGGILAAIAITASGMGYVNPTVVITGGGGTGATATALAGSQNLPFTSTNAIQFSGGADGNNSVTGITELGVDGQNPTGMYALRNANVSLFALVDNDNAATYSDQDQFAGVTGSQAILVGPAGQTVTDAIAAKKSAGLSDNSIVFLLGDWCFFLDTNNKGTVRLISPQGYYGGKMANLSPELSPLNKQIFGILATQKTQMQMQYSDAELVTMMQSGIEVITNPVPAGSIFGCATGKSGGTDLTNNDVCVQRMANFLGLSMSRSGVLGTYIGQLQTPTVRVSARAALDTFLTNLEVKQQIKTYDLVLDDTNNPDSQVSLGFMQAQVDVRLFSVTIVFLINLNVGTVTSTIQG